MVMLESDPVGDDLSAWTTSREYKRLEPVLYRKSGVRGRGVS